MRNAVRRREVLRGTQWKLAQRELHVTQPNKAAPPMTDRVLDPTHTQNVFMYDVRPSVRQFLLSFELQVRR